ncbi:MAG: excinuclease ABC subunit UvrC [Actinomycetes bacterium]
MDVIPSRDERLREQRLKLPDEPGVYMFRNVGGDVIYVGKANSIRKRVASHFNRPSGRRGTEMVAAIDQIESVVVGSGTEALIAEQAFIKTHRPRFNVLLRDDKSYPFIGISTDEKFPRIYITRERQRRDRLYFGPYTNPRRVRQTLDVLGKVFMFRSCEGPEPGRHSGSPCLDFHIDRCEAPCIGNIDEQHYRESLDGAIAFLSGRQGEVEEKLELQMNLASSEQRYEDAARARNRLSAIRSLTVNQTVSNTTVGTLDAIAVAVGERDANAQVFQIREGVLTDRLSYYLDSAGGDVAEVAEAFIVQHYERTGSIPPLVLVQPELANAAGTPALVEALSERRGSAVEVRAGERGDRRQLLEMARRNADLALGQERLRAERRMQQRTASLEGLRQQLDLDSQPIRIECYDISHTMGTETVASMVVFEGGVPAKGAYRRFRIRDAIAGAPDDFASMEQVLSRRLERWKQESDLSPHEAKRDASFAALPDLIVIDGGKGQLAAGLRALDDFVERGVRVISLAKRIEEVFQPGQREPLLMNHDSPELQLLQRLRDEAHRFALAHHRARRDKAMTDSVLDGLPGVGSARRGALLRHFGSADAVLAASREELVATPGMPERVAREIYEYMHRMGS